MGKDLPRIGQDHPLMTTKVSAVRSQKSDLCLSIQKSSARVAFSKLDYLQQIPCSFPTPQLSRLKPRGLWRVSPTDDGAEVAA